jgi:hypothetical protein
VRPLKHISLNRLVFSLGYWLLNQNKSFHLRFYISFVMDLSSYRYSYRTPHMPIKKLTITEKFKFSCWEHSSKYIFLLALFGAGSIIWFELQLYFLNKCSITILGKIWKRKQREIFSYIPFAQSFPSISFSHIPLCFVHSGNCSTQESYF